MLTADSSVMRLHGRSVPSRLGRRWSGGGSGVELLEWLRIDDPIGAVRCTASAASGVPFRLGCLPAVNMERQVQLVPTTP